MENFYAHTDPEFLDDQSKWEPLFSEDCDALKGPEYHCDRCESLDSMHGHLNKVAWWAGKFAAEMFPAGSEEAKNAREWGYLAGLWHDLGKFAPEWQAYLTEAAKGKAQRGPDHSTAGAQHAVSSIPGFGSLLAFQVAGHHGGLMDAISTKLGSSLRDRLNNRKIKKWTAAPECLLDRNFPEVPPCSPKAGEIAFFNRQLFSALVDADFLATEAFMNPAQAESRAIWPVDILKRMQATLEDRFEKFGESDKPINRFREAIRQDCMRASSRPPGLFTLTVPTGGGKTLSSLAFAINHALKNDLRRIIFVIPYTSIIEQNAEGFRETFAALSDEIGSDLVLEHHSSFDPESTDDFPVYKLAFENWDAPLVVTTSVQFFESLFASKTSRCRKLHNISRSVVIFDESQNLPVEFLHPCLDVIKNLIGVGQSSVVLCTATQPAIGKREDEFEIGLPLDRENEIVSDPLKLYRAFERVTIENAGELSDDHLVGRLKKCERVLCIVNTKPHAAAIFEKIGPDNPENLHLSAQLCPEHRQSILAEVRRREKEGEPCRLISTTVVEAGVDIDFPVVYRAMTGLASFAQAAGRCNRHNRLAPEKGWVYLFSPSDTPTPKFLTQSVNATHQVLPDFSATELLGLDAVEKYFRLYYWLKGETVWDSKKVIDDFEVCPNSPDTPFLFNYRSAAEKFRLIPQTQMPVIVEPRPGLWADQDREKSKSICKLLETVRERDQFKKPPPPDCHRQLQRYTVSIPKPLWEQMVQSGAIQLYIDARFPILTHPENSYDKMTGLRLPHIDRSEAFII